MKLYSLTNPYMHGEDLKPLQKALKAAKLYLDKVDGVFGTNTANACRNAKWRLGYAEKFCTPTGGQTLLDYLQGNKSLPLTYKVRRKQRGFGDDNQQTIREAIVAHALWGVANRSAIHYLQSRPMDHLTRVRVLPWDCDCSEFVTTIYKWAGAPDPNRLEYNGQGYTGTMLIRGQTLRVQDAVPSDVVIWGEYPGHHTAVITDVSNKKNPMLVSMGSEGDPREITLADETAAQGRSYVIKRYF